MRRVSFATVAVLSVACGGRVLAYDAPDAGDDGSIPPEDGSASDVVSPPKDGGTDVGSCGAKTMCNSTCVDTTTDPQNCGACAKVCDVGDAGAPPDGGTLTPTCAAGTCGLQCGGILSPCSGNCVDTSADPLNCGSCGNACDAGSCSNAVCAMATTVKVGNVADLGAVSSHWPNYLLGTSIQVTKTSKLLSFGVLSKGSGPQAIMALYTDSAGSPGTLVTNTAAFTLTSSSQEVAASTQATLPVGTYWLVAEYDKTGAIGYTASAPSVTTKYVTHTFGSPLPASFPAPSSYAGQQFNYWIGVSQ